MEVFSAEFYIDTVLTYEVFACLSVSSICSWFQYEQGMYLLRALGGVSSRMDSQELVRRSKTAVSSMWWLMWLVVMSVGYDLLRAMESVAILHTLSATLGKM